MNLAITSALILLECLGISANMPHECKNIKTAQDYSEYKQLANPIMYVKLTTKPLRRPGVIINGVCSTGDKFTALYTHSTHYLDHPVRFQLQCTPTNFTVTIDTGVTLTGTLYYIHSKDSISYSRQWQTNRQLSIVVHENKLTTPLLVSELNPQPSDLAKLGENASIEGTATPHDEVKAIDTIPVIDQFYIKEAMEGKKKYSQEASVAYFGNTGYELQASEAGTDIRSFGKKGKCTMALYKKFPKRLN